MTLRLEAGPWRAEGTAVVNPAHTVGARLVLRRSRHADADTLAVDATLVAESVGRELAAALSEPGRAVTLTITEQEPPAPVVILAPAAPPGRLGALWRLAAVTVLLDGAAGRPGRSRAAGSGAHRWAEAALVDAASGGGIVRAVTPTPPALLGPDAIERLVALVGAGPAWPARPTR